MLVHIVASVSAIILCWGAVAALLWVRSRTPSWDDYALGSIQVLLSAMLTMLAIGLGWFALLSPWLPLGG